MMLGTENELKKNLMNRQKINLIKSLKVNKDFFITEYENGEMRFLERSAKFELLSGSWNNEAALSK